MDALHISDDASRDSVRRLFYHPRSHPWVYTGPALWGNTAIGFL